LLIAMPGAMAIPGGTHAGHVSLDALKAMSAIERCRTAARGASEALLVGRIFDDRGNRITPSHARRRGIKYRYYTKSH